jgi:ubiquinone/menaquinone biosynthesis C-methylase UbiE
MRSDVPQRISWAVGLLNVQPGEDILEIGCGTGAAVSLICERLEGGNITAIDRSEKMARLAVERNASGIKSGKVTIKQAELLEQTLPAAAFDKILFFNLNVFWMDPVAELKEVRRLLAPRASLYVFHNPPPGGDLREYARAIAANLEKNGFSSDAPVFDDTVASLFIRSTPISLL